MTSSRSSGHHSPWLNPPGSTVSGPTSHKDTVCHRLPDSPGFRLDEPQDGWLWCYTETRLGSGGPDALCCWWQPLVCQPQEPECWGSSLLTTDVVRTVWPCAKVLASLALVPENICLLQGHWQVKWTILGVLTLSALSKQQTAHCVTSASGSGFSVTDLGLQANGQIIPVCLPVSILAKEGVGINRSLAGRISLWSEQSQSPRQQWFDWLLTSWTSQLGFKALNPWDVDIQAVGASGGRSWAWKDRWTFKTHGEHRLCCYTMQEEKAAGEPSSLEVPVPREFLRNGRIPKNSQQRPAGCQVASVFQQLSLLTEWAISVGMSEEMTKHSVRCCLLFPLTSPPLALLHFF